VKTDEESTITIAKANAKNFFPVFFIKTTPFCNPLHRPASLYQRNRHKIGTGDGSFVFGTKKEEWQPPFFFR
jgi:hypothetical protein